MKVKLVLVEPEGKINFGFIIRLAKNFEVDEIDVIRPKFDVNDEEVLRFAAQGKDFIKRVKVLENFEDALEGLSVCTSAKVSDIDPLRTFLVPWELKEKLGEPNTLTLVFGRESVGLTREELSKCDALLHIPASKNYPVLNLSHAVAIVLWEVWKQYRLERGHLPARPSEEEIDIVMKVTKELADIFIRDEKKREMMLVALRRLIAKGTKLEVRSLLYLLSRCLNFVKKK